MNYKSSSRIVDKEHRIQRAKVNAYYLVNSEDSQILDTATYLTCSEDERLEKLMNLFNKMNPNWRTYFNEKEEQKPSKMRIYMKPDKNGSDLESFIEEAQGDTVSQCANSLFLANKIAHACQNTMKNLVEGVLYEKSKQLSSQKDYYMVRKIDSLYENIFEFENIVLAFRRYFDLSKRNTKTSTLQTEQQISRQKAILAEYKIDMADLQKLASLGFCDLMELSYNAFVIKDYEISKLITELEDRDDIDYGMAVKTDNDGTSKENIFVMNLPYYGQFCVHLKLPAHIKALESHPYCLDELYEFETIMLTSEVSPSAREDFDQGASISKQKLRLTAQKDPRYALYLALKTGHEKDTIREIFNTSKTTKRIQSSSDAR